VRDFPFPGKTERPPSSPYRLSLGSWRSAFKGAFKEFLADDCLGLAQQVAFSSLLAFFPAVVFLVGMLDLVGAYGSLKEFLAPVAPGDVIKTIDTLQSDTSRATSVVAFVVGAAGAVWAASGAMNAVIKAVNRAYDRVETRAFWQTRLIGILLVGLMGLVLAGLLLLIVFGGPLGTAIADQAGLGSAFELVWSSSYSSPSCQASLDSRVASSPSHVPGTASARSS